ncbi:hypothetical protein N9937_00955 [bacterium]|nr:hypothetical protein [bacterium]
MKTRIIKEVRTLKSGRIENIYYPQVKEWGWWCTVSATGKLYQVYTLNIFRCHTYGYNCKAAAEDVLNKYGWRIRDREERVVKSSYTEVLDEN